MSNSIITCPICGLTQRLEPLPPGMVAECSRCDSPLAKARDDRLGRTAAFSLAALLFYIPANIYPIMRMDFHGVFTESTVWDGCNGSWRSLFFWQVCSFRCSSCSAFPSWSLPPN